MASSDFLIIAFCVVFGVLFLFAVILLLVVIYFDPNSRVLTKLRPKKLVTVRSTTLFQVDEKTFRSRLTSICSFKFKIFYSSIPDSLCAVKRAPSPVPSGSPLTNITRPSSPIPEPFPVARRLSECFLRPNSGPIELPVIVYK